jgi:RNA recognition motif-containing protein
MTFKPGRNELIGYTHLQLVIRKSQSCRIFKPYSKFLLTDFLRYRVINSTDNGVRRAAVIPDKTLHFLSPQPRPWLKIPKDKLTTKSKIYNAMRFHTQEAAHF